MTPTRQTLIAFAAIALIVLPGCAPSVQDCHAILPVVAEPVTVTPTPAGTPGCSCMTDGVLVVAEARRTGFSWARGQLWVEGTPVSEQDFSSRLAQVKARRQVRHGGRATQGRRAGRCGSRAPGGESAHGFSSTLRLLVAFAPSGAA